MQNQLLSTVVGLLDVQRKGNRYLLTCSGQTDNSFKVYPSHCPNTFSCDSRVTHLSAGEEITIELHENRRYFFHCIDDMGNMNTMAERRLSLEGTPNFRDYGGYLTGDGRRIRWGRLFRSGQLATLTSNDLQYLESLDVKLVCDFRRDDERKRDPSQFPEAALPDVIGLPIHPGSSTGFYENIYSGNISAIDMVDFMCSINREFALEQSQYYKAMFKHLLQLEQGASLIHCAAGKDRTGFAAAVILSALGVSRETILEDYMLTDRYFNPDKEIDRISQKYQWRGDLQAMRPMLETREPYLLNAFDAIDQNFSNMDEYLDVMLGVGVVEREILQDRYLL